MSKRSRENAIKFYSCSTNGKMYWAVPLTDMLVQVYDRSFNILFNVTIGQLDAFKTKGFCVLVYE